MKTMNKSRSTYGVFKRALDIVFSLLLIIISSPLLIIISIASLFAIGAPVFFSQSLPGKNGRLFKLRKFRMMDVSASIGVEAVSTDEARLTRYGSFLRRSSLDELPELFNILIGDMSFVGPRPLLVEYLPLYSPHQTRRHEVRPGLTGLAQINGRNDLAWPQRFDFDVEYAEHMSFAVDLGILVDTVRVVFSGSGVVAGGSSTTTPFKGER
ncbi:MAG: sugar transferase [Coriobacteriia bacterium]|nr:sugar transferase [Coriobacteriia bacterium]